MSTGQTKTAAAGVGLLAVMTLLVSTQGLTFFKWAVGELKIFAGLPLFGPVTIAVFVGAVAAAWLPHLLPKSTQRPYTLRITRLLACGIAFVMVAARYPNAIGFQYAMFAASGSYVLWSVASNYVYTWFPGIKPEALVDKDVFCEGVRRRALAEGRRVALTEVGAWAEADGEGETKTATRVREALVKR